MSDLNYKKEEEKEASGLNSSSGTLEKFIAKIKRQELSKSAEEYFNQGQILLAKNEFDAAIEEFVKVILISSPQEKWHLSAQQALKEMGFSETDGAVMAGIKAEEVTHLPFPPFWDNRKEKLKSLFFMALAVFALTLPWSLFSILVLPILFFPAGLIGLISDYNQYALLIFPLWVIYFGLAFAIVRTNKKKIIIIAYIILIVLLILNVAGCHVIGPSIMSTIH